MYPNNAANDPKRKPAPDARPIVPQAYGSGSQPMPGYDEYDDPEDAGPGGPGCLIWGLMLGFTLLFGVFLVALAALFGWTDGLQVAQGNATATRSADIAVQCERIGVDMANGRMGLVEARLADIMQVTPLVDCVPLYVPTATALYFNSLPTATPTVTATPSPTQTPTATQVIQQVAPTVPAAPAATESPFDLPSLLAEARGLIQTGENIEAIDTLEAIRALDPNFQKNAVDTLLFDALTSEALDLFRSGQSLAEAILLTDRARAYGDVGELNFEANVAQLYLDAQSFRGINYSEAIRLLNRVISFSPNYLDARTQLFNEYVAYGDALAAGFEHCRALEQYNAALQLQPAPNVTTKRDQATINCPTTQPGAPGNPATPAGQPIAPIGVPGT